MARLRSDAQSLEKYFPLPYSKFIIARIENSYSQVDQNYEGIQLPRRFKVVRLAAATTDFFPFSLLFGFGRHTRLNISKNPITAMDLRKYLCA
jgi:hypothetical protein